MIVRRTYWHVSTLLLISMSSVCLAQSAAGPKFGPNKLLEQKAFATKLVEAKTDDERATLLIQNRQLMTAELTQLFLDLGRDYLQQGNMALAIESFEIANMIAKKRDDKPLLARSLTTLGNLYRMQGKDELALKQLRQALPLHDAQSNARGIFFTLLYIVILDISSNTYDEAMLQRLVQLAEESKNDEWRALSLSQTGSMQFLQGNYALALESHQKSLNLYERSGAKEGQSFALHAIGIIQRVYGNYEQALDNFEKSLALTESLGRKDLAPRALSSIGAIYQLLGHHDQALKYHENSLRVGESTGGQFWTIFSLNNMGEIYRSQGQFPQALAHLERALKLSEELKYNDRIAYVCISIGDIKYSEGDYLKAIEFGERAIAIARQTSSRDALWKALTLAGRAYYELNQRQKAQELLEEATNTVEVLRSNVAGQELRRTYFATVQRPYEVLIDFLMQRHKQEPNDGNDMLALHVNERALARSLLEALTETNAEIRKGVDPILLERERVLQQQLNVRAARQTRLSNGDESAVLKKEIDRLTDEYKRVQAQIRHSSPRYAALTQPVPLTMRQIQAEVLDADTALLEYSLGDSRSYLWFVTSTSHETFELPKRAEIEVDVRRVVELFSDGKRWETKSEVNAQYPDEATKLSQELLPAPLMSRLKAKRLVIVADGALQYLPFEALPNLKFADASPLLSHYEIVRLPSASTLAVLRRESKNRPLVTKSVAVIADPVFEETDERVKAKKVARAVNSVPEDPARKTETSGSRALLLRAVGLGGRTEADGAREDLRIPRLPFTRFEAEAILAAAPKKQSLRATDFRANRETATSTELSQYRFVHFATHALLNSQHPELSGIVLSLVDYQGEPVDGFLRLHDIYNLNLAADLVVLSACQTGLGKEIRGEGLVGLTRGFMYAGAPRVVASLWKVDDAATAELMKRFYTGMLKDKLRPAAALRRAKIEMLKQKRWQSPFYWAAFELQGEWR